MPMADDQTTVVDSILEGAERAFAVAVSEQRFGVVERVLAIAFRVSGLEVPEDRP